MTSTQNVWPPLPYADWQDTCTTLHMWSQVVGKIRLAQAPMVNHWWQVALYVTARGLTTSPMPHGAGLFQIDFDFIAHRLLISLSDGRGDSFSLKPMSVSAFHADLIGRLRALGIDVHIWTKPQAFSSFVTSQRIRRVGILRRLG